MNLYRTSRKHFESIDREDFWQIAFDNEQEELFYWRKAYDLDSWFYQNASIIEDYSNELTKEILEKLINWLIDNNFKDDAKKIKKIILENDFKENVI